PRQTCVFMSIRAIRVALVELLAVTAGGGARLSPGRRSRNERSAAFRLQKRRKIPSLSPNPQMLDHSGSLQPKGRAPFAWEKSAQKNNNFGYSNSARRRTPRPQPGALNNIGENLVFLRRFSG